MRGNGINIRRATRADLDDAQKLEHTTFTTYAISPRQMRYLAQSPNAVFLIARRGRKFAGDAIGLVRRHRGGILSGRIYSLVVDPAHRGESIGRKLTAALIKEMKRRGVRRIYLEVAKSNSAAIGLYEQLGFRIIKALKDYYARGDHGVQMRLTLKFDTNSRK